MPEEKYRLASYRSIVLTYIALLVLAAVSVTISALNLGRVNLWGPLAIAPVQAGLVVFFFMHMRHESRILRILFLTVLVVLALLIALTYVDTLYRGVP